MADGFASWESYLYPPPDHATLVNLFDERHGPSLRLIEYGATFARQRELEQLDLPRTFDGAHLRAIHGHLFQDVYEWAGEYRTVNMVKAGSPRGFAETGEIDRYLDRAADVIATTPWESLDRDGFARAAAEVYANVNHAHPFREGNGRATKVLMEHVAERSSFVLDYARVDARTWNQAAALTAPDLFSYDPVPDAVVPVFRELAQPREQTPPAAAPADVIPDMSRYRASFPQPASEATRRASDVTSSASRRYGSEQGPSRGRGGR